MKYVLAGASGFLGTALARDLVADGHQVLRLVRRTPSNAGRSPLGPGPRRPGSGRPRRSRRTGQPGRREHRPPVDPDVPAEHPREPRQHDRHPGGRRGTTRATAGADHAERYRRLRPGLRRSRPHRGLRTRRGLPRRRRPRLGRRPRTRPRGRLPRRRPPHRHRPRPQSTGVPVPVLPFRLGLGGRLGPGTQYFPVVSLTDWLRGVRFVAEHDTLSGPVNLALPHPATNEEFTEAVATALHRPALIPVPAFLMKAALGEFAWELLGSNRSLPTRLQSQGFTFHHPTAQSALSAALTS